MSASLNLGGGRRRQNPEARIMITSMMDIFTIILTFLLIQYNTDDQSLAVARNLEIPESSSELTHAKGLRLSIAKDAVLLDDQVIVVINKGKIVGSRPGDPKILPLYHELQRHKRRLVKQEAEAREKSAPQALSQLIFESDRHTPYTVVDSVLKTAAMAGFPKVRMVVQGSS